MAILPRTLLTQPAPAAVAAVSLVGFTILAMAAFDAVEKHEFFEAYEVPCAELDASQGARQFWEEIDHVRYVFCFEQHHDTLRAIDAAAVGLTYFPDSEVLYSSKGYNEIVRHEYDAAIETLEAGLGAVTPTDGVMENNLAWSYLWVGKGATDRSRSLYSASLQREPYVCETLHTGLFVEFAIARTSRGLEKADALRNFQSLRTRYQDCANRDAKWNTGVEAVGASVLYHRVEEMTDSGWDQKGLDLTMQVTASMLREHHPSASVGILCGEAMPLRDLRQECVNEVQQAIRATSPTRNDCKR